MSSRCYPDHYDVLQVPATADSAAVRAAFRALIRRWHPDCAGQAGSPDHAARIIDAYRTLSHPERRQQYDRRRTQIPMVPGTDRRRGERRQQAGTSPGRIAGRRPVDRGQMVLWTLSAGGAAAIAIATFLPPLMNATDLSREVLRALM